MGAPPLAESFPATAKVMGVFGVVVARSSLAIGAPPITRATLCTVTPPNTSVVVMVSGYEPGTSRAGLVTVIKPVIGFSVVPAGSGPVVSTTVRVPLSPPVTVPVGAL